MALDKMRTVTLNGESVEEKKVQIRDYFLDAIEKEESLFSLLKNDDSFYEQPEPLRHPLVFYFGHTHTFYINKLFTSSNISKRVNSEFESMFAIGVDEMSWDDLNEAHYDWASIEDIREYRKKVKDLVLEFIDKTPMSLPITWESPFWIILMGIEHHRIHIETSSVLIRQLDLKFINESEPWSPCTEQGEAPDNMLLPVKGGEVHLGKKNESTLYGWDNEYGSHSSLLKDFSASQFLVSNAEMNEFINEGGYKKKTYWSDEGWKWNQFSRASKPTFWIEKDERLFLRVLDREIPMPWNWPVETNCLEAEAFCRWKSETLGVDIRLPTEDEWELLRKNEAVRDLPEWQERVPGNIDLEFNSPVPINKFKFDQFYDVIGNVWQWTETPIYPFQGFKVHPVYDDFTVPTFDHRHNLIKGGSFISTGNEATASSRYAFRKHFFQHAGFRYVHSENTMEIEDNIYETDTLLAQYCEFHFGDKYFDVPNFPKACIREVEKYLSKLKKTSKALDLGCAVGRSTLELAKHFDHTTGLDFSARFIEKAQSIIDEGTLRYGIPAEGDILDYYERSLEDMELAGIKDKVEFYQADACNMPKKYGNYDLIFAGNLIDRLYSPSLFLEKISDYINDGGLLVITSPYTWLEEYTPKSEWIGGYKKDGENFTTLDGLTEKLSYAFTRISEPVAIPFVIRETANKYQHTLSQMTVWQKK